MRVHEPLLGTRAELHVTAETDSTANTEAIETDVFAEVARLEAIFTVFDKHSELHRLRSTGQSNVPELREVHDLAMSWQQRTNGAFTSTMQPIIDVWNDAELRNLLPTEDSISEAVTIASSHSTRHLDFNGVAKGWIAARALDIACRQLTDDHNHGIADAWLNIGGDVVHCGANGVTVGIEDPKRPYDNVPPLRTIRLRNEALATSGGSRRWWVIEGQRFSKVLDPRTGRPVSEIASATIVAPTAATADVLATAALVLKPDETLAFCQSVDADCLLILDSGQLISSSQRFEH